jgi:phage gpG-like protein
MDGANFTKTRYNKPSNIVGKANAFRKEFNQMTLRMGKMAREHVDNNFRAEGFVDETLHRWPKLRAPKPSGKKILVRTGRMKRTTRIVNRTRNNVSLSTPVAYAGIHNRPVGQMRQYEGGKYPGRMFMGHSKVLAAATQRMIVTRLNLAAQV